MKHDFQEGDHEKKNSMTPKSRMYVYATECVADYYSKVDLREKTVLTIIGSADQILNAYFFGAKRVIGFDINTRAPLFAELKIAAIHSFTFEEFLDFFGSNMKNGTFDHRLYSRIKNSLSDETQKFFGMVYKEAADNPLKSEYFRERSFLDVSATKINAYLKDVRAYDTMREILSTVTPEYVVGDIRELANGFPAESFDVINLSNVLNYFVGRNEERLPDMLILLSTLARSVRTGGVIFFYSYSPVIYKDTSFDSSVPPASRESTRKLIESIGIFQISEISFIGTNGKEPDKITILKKV